jgi:hypothetical protein
MIRRSFIISSAAWPAVALGRLARAADTIGGRYVATARTRGWASSAPGAEGHVGQAGRHHRHDGEGPFGLEAGLGCRFRQVRRALTISLHRGDGGVFGCQVAHQALKRQPVSVLGSIKAEDVSFAGERVKARFTSNGPIKIFDETCEVDIRVDVAIRPKAA